MAEPLRPEPLVGATDAGVAAPPLGHHLLRRLGSAFAYRDFRTLWLGAFTSAAGTWTQRFAQQLLVFALTGSAFYVGLDAFLGGLPLLLFMLIGGVTADRYDRRYLLLGSQCVQMASAFVLVALVYSDVIRIQHVLALSFVSGVAQAFGGPAFQSLIPSLVPRKDLPNAIALNAIQFNLASALGPQLGALVLAALGLAWCFGINGVSFLVVIVVLLSLQVKHVPPASRRPLLTELRTGLSYVRHEGSLLALTVLAFSSTFLGQQLQTFLVVFADDAIHLSRMMTAFGAGAIVGSLVVAWLGRFRHMGLTLLLVQVVFGTLIAAFALSPASWPRYAVLFLVGAAFMMVFSLTNSLVQLTAPNRLRGRVISIYLMAFRGGMPLGSLITGYVISVTSPWPVMAVNGVVLAGVTCYFLARSHGVREL